MFLPPEIWLQVGESISRPEASSAYILPLHARSTLRSLAIVNKLLLSLILPILYRHVDLDQATLPMFHDTICCSSRGAHLARLVEALQVDELVVERLKRLHQSTRNDYHALAEMLEVMQHTLRRLSITITGGDNYKLGAWALETSIIRLTGLTDLCHPHRPQLYKIALASTQVGARLQPSLKKVVASLETVKTYLAYDLLPEGGVLDVFVTDVRIVADREKLAWACGVLEDRRLGGRRSLTIGLRLVLMVQDQAAFGRLCSWWMLYPPPLRSLWHAVVLSESTEGGSLKSLVASGRLWELEVKTLDDAIRKDVTGVSLHVAGSVERSSG